MAQATQWGHVERGQSPRKNIADLGGGWTRDLLVSSRTAHPTEPPRSAIGKIVTKSSMITNRLSTLMAGRTIDYPALACTVVSFLEC